MAWTGERDAEEAEKRVTYLIEMLASKNAAPEIVGDARRGEDSYVRFGEHYDKSAQVPIYLALRQLLAEGETAFDLLLRHSDDTRYSYSVNDYRDWNRTVGGACKAIVRRNILCYEPHIHVISRAQFGLYPPLDYKKANAPAGWWHENRQRGLAVIQVEAIDAELKFMHEVDGRTAPAWHAQAARLPLKEFNRLRDENVRILEALRDSVSKSGIPYPASDVEGQNRSIFGLPWTGRKYNK